MDKSILTYIGLLLLWTLVLFSFSEDDKVLWAQIDSPKLNGTIQLYQKERNMHQAPEILVYFQSKKGSKAQPIGHVLLPEDDRSKITYDYEWKNKDELILQLYCEPCMIEQRTYILNLEHKSFSFFEKQSSGNLPKHF